MKLRSGVYIVPTDRWYIERTVWLIAGIVLLASTTMALVVNRAWILGVIATGLVSINVAFTGFCPVGNVLRLLGFTSMLGSERTTRWYRMKTDKWYLERRIYLFVGINISVASLIVLFFSKWATLFTGFVGGAMVWFAVTGFCVMANGLYWLGAEPRLNPEALPSARCTECPKSGECLGGHPILAPVGSTALTEQLVPLSVGRRIQCRPFTYARIKVLSFPGPSLPPRDREAFATAPFWDRRLELLLRPSARLGKSYAASL